MKRTGLFLLTNLAILLVLSLVVLVDTVRRQAQMAGIGMPEIALYEAPEVNAFATGMNRNSALVAVSTGLLRAMDRDEAEAVLAHEVSHVANGDMVTCRASSATSSTASCSRASASTARRTS